MQKNNLIKIEDNIYRILDIMEDSLLVIDCQKMTMPKWINNIEEFFTVSEAEISEKREMSAEEQRVAQKRFSVISDIIPKISNKRAYTEAIELASERFNYSKQTIRHWLCKYLVFQDITALAPKSNAKNRPLTQDEKNMRWGLNKFYYTSHRNSLMEAYTMLLSAKYTDANGRLLNAVPSFFQFRYFYRKTRKFQNYYISRNGIKDYQRNHRPLTGDGVQEYADHVGVGMLDSTICDIYLVDSAGQLVGRPILTAAVDAYSSYCLGYLLSLEGGTYSLKGLVANMVSDKTEYCKKYGITISNNEWDSTSLPGIMLTDKGKEYVSDSFSQITDLGVTLIDLPSYRPELKGIVEKFFDLIQDSFKPYLKGRGVIDSDWQERGAHDYRKDACLTMEDFEKVILRCILYYNNNRVIENYPYTEDMLSVGIKPYAADIWEYGKRQSSEDLIDVDYETLMLTLLPRTIGTFTRYGLKVNHLRYHAEGFTERYLGGGEVTVAYNQDNVSYVWLIEEGQYIRFELIESRFLEKSLSEVEVLKKGQSQLVKNEVRDNLQAKIDLAEHLQAIAENRKNSETVSIKGISDNKKRARREAHVDFMEGINE